MDKRPIAFFALGIIVSAAFFVGFPLLQTMPSSKQTAQAPKVTQAPQELQKFKASAMNRNWEAAFLVIDAGKDRGIWTKYGLEPDFIHTNGSLLAYAGGEKIGSDIKMGFGITTEVLSVRSGGVPLKIVAGHLGQASVYMYVRADSPFKNVKDLDGMKFGAYSKDSWTYWWALYVANKFGIKLDIVLLGVSQPAISIAALKAGRIDAFFSAQSAVLRLVDSGELRTILRMGDLFPDPWATNVVFASEDLIQTKPDLVGRFVKATLESAKLLRENPDYAIDLYVKRSDAPRDLARNVVSQLSYSSTGRGTGSDLIAAVRNAWQFVKDSGEVPLSAWEKVRIEDAVDARFLP